jgi:hypothetical protein
MLSLSLSVLLVQCKKNFISSTTPMPTILCHSLSLSLRDTHCRVACFAILQMLVVVEADIVTQLSRSS